MMVFIYVWAGFIHMALFCEKKDKNHSETGEDVC